MSTKLNQQIVSNQDYVLVCVESFLKDRTSQNLARGTIKYYRDNLKIFTDFLDSQSIKFISQITSSSIREFLLLLETRGHNPGGIHSFYRCVKTFLRWYWEEEEPGYPNPVSKVKAPKVPIEPIEGISLEQFKVLLSVCGVGFVAERDRAILKVLLDTGMRANEMCNLRMDDLNLIENSLFILKGKGRKPRYTFFGRATKKQLKKYLKLRNTNCEYLFVTRTGDKLLYPSLRQVIRRLSDKAGFKGIGLHDFRRTFCLESLNRGIPEITIARLMGHTTTVLIGRYAKQTTVDLMNQYRSVVDG